MSNWNHKGFDITMQGASFATQLPSKHIIVPSLKAAQKAIDKHLETKAKAIELSLPVVFLESPGRYSRQEGEGEVKIVHGIITGIDPDSFAVVGLDENRNSREFTMPESAENEALIISFLSSEKIYYELKKQIESRTVSTYFSRYGRNKPQYADIVAKLQAGYERAVKADAA